MSYENGIFSDDFAAEQSDIIDAEMPVEEEEQRVALREPVSPKKPGRANIVVLGIGGAGSNAVSNMVKKGVESATFVVMNTDMQALNRTAVPANNKIQLGENETGGLGAGSDPEVGRRAAIESKDIIKDALRGIDLLFITAGMGGGTGTGAAPVVAEIAKSLGILTVGVVTKPFNFEGAQRQKNAEEGIKKLKDYVDTLLVISNQKLIEELDADISFRQAFEVADEVLRQGVQSVSDVIVNPEIINLDFADVRTVLSHRGYAYMGIGNGAGEKRVIDAVRSAVRCPLLETNIEGASALIINITGGDDLKLSEVNEACDLVKQVLDPNANIIFGMMTRPEKQDISITIIATGFNNRPATAATIAPRFEYAPQAAADIAEQQPTQSAEMFANRPVFTRTESAQTEQAKAVPQDRASSSRINLPERPVPAFMQRLRNNSEDK